MKETDRIAAIAHNLRIMGAQVMEMNDGLEIHGPAPLRGARVASFGDHRIAMAFAVAGLFAEGETIVQDADCIREVLPELRDGSGGVYQSEAVSLDHSGDRFVFRGPAGWRMMGNTIRG